MALKHAKTVDLSQEVAPSLLTICGVSGVAVMVLWCFSRICCKLTLPMGQKQVHKCL